MKILIPIDDSKYSKAALKFIATRSANFGKDAEFIIVNIHPVSFIDSLLGGAKAEETFREEAEEILKPAVEQLTQANLNARSIFKTGSVADTINKIAEEENVDMIVMGSQGTSSIQGIIFGSVTNSLLAITYKPMLVLHEKMVDLKDSCYIGVADDGSDYADNAVRFLAKNMSMFGGTPRVYLINVVERPAPGASDYELEREAAEEHKEFVGEVFDEDEKMLRNSGAECRRVKLVGDDPGDAIAEFAEKEDLDLIVIGTRGKGSFHATVMGSTATRVAAVSDRPQLIIQTDEDKLEK